MSEEIETGVSHIAYFRTDSGSSKLYTQEYVDDLQNQLQQKDKEIERLKELCDKYEEEHKTTFEEWKKTINIIKEVREYIMSNLITEWDIENNGYVSGSDLPADAITPILGILDKEVN